MICYACNNDFPQAAPKPFYLCPLCKGEVKVMTEDEARKTITDWAKHHFREEFDPEPDVEIIEIHPTDEDNDEWEATLSVSTSADDPNVTFFMADEPGYGLQIVSIDY